MEREKFPHTYHGKYTIRRDLWEMMGGEWPPKYGERINIFIPTPEQVGIVREKSSCKKIISMPIPFRKQAEKTSREHSLVVPHNRFPHQLKKKKY